MSNIDRAELRRLLDEAETPWTIEQATPNMGGPNWLLRREGKAGIIISAHEYGFRERGEFIVAAVNALPGLLDALEKAEGHRDSLAATLIEVQREKLALERAIERVRPSHTPGDVWCNFHDSAWCDCAIAHRELLQRMALPDDPALGGGVRALHTPGDEWCGYHNSALCECANVYCEECGFSWPCPTIQALDGGE